MSRSVGTVVRGVRAPIAREGDNLPEIMVSSLLHAMESEGFPLNDGDIYAATEAIVARCQGNYATLDQIAEDVRAKTGGGTVGLVLPILSRNRFFILLKAIAMGVEKLIVQLAYPSDEVGNPIVSIDAVDEKDVNPYTDVFTEEQFTKLFGSPRHPFTGVDYVELYKSAGDNIEIIFGNDPKAVLEYANVVIAADIHSRKRTKRILKADGAKVLGLDEFLNTGVSGSGYNPEYGLLGSNQADDSRVKLFPRDCQAVVSEVQGLIFERTGKKLEIMVYGDGAFKDPVAGIWELADPVVSPGYTSGLSGTNSECKIKYLADTKFKHLSGEEASKALSEYIAEFKENADNSGNESLGTTPRNITDLVGSLCDLTTGSGDKGTPFVLIQGYFDHF